MRSNRQNIPLEDVRTALQDVDPEKRAIATMRLAQKVKTPDLSQEDRAYANKILEIISEDVSELVRRALAITLKNSPFIPKLVLKRLISDIESIAVPLITHSPILDDEDYHTVLHSRISGKLKALAGRAGLSNKIVLALIDLGDRQIARDIAANDTAEISEDAATAMIEAYREDDLIRAKLMNRAAMPMAVVEKLIAASTDDIASRLYADTDMTQLQSEQIGQETHQRTIARLPNEYFSETTLKDLTHALQVKGRLMPSLLLRAAGLGQIDLVHYGLAALSGLSVRKVVLMLHDTGPFARRAVCTKAGFDTLQTSFMDAMINIYTDLESTGQKLDKDAFQTHMLERVLTLPIALLSEDAEYFMSVLDGLGVSDI